MTFVLHNHELLPTSMDDPTLLTSNGEPILPKKFKYNRYFGFKFDYKGNDEFTLDSSRTSIHHFPKRVKVRI